MESIKLRYLATKKAYIMLSQMLNKLEIARLNNSVDDDIVIAFRDSVIKRFEISYDLTWKFLKCYFERSTLSISSPKSAFQTCFQQGLTTEDETRILLNMIDDRNLTVHTYSEDLAEQVSLRIVVYYNAMKLLISKLEPLIEISDLERTMQTKNQATHENT